MHVIWGYRGGVVRFLKIKWVGVFVLLLVLSANLSAKSSYSKLESKDDFRISFGVANIKAHEYSWNGGHKLSELEWSIDSVPLISIFSSNVIFDSFMFDMMFYFSMGNGSGTLVDDDWQDMTNPSKHTDHSEHESYANTLRGVDLFLKSLPFEFADNLYAGIGVGYRRDYLKATARNGWAKHKCSGGYPNGCNFGVYDTDVIWYEQKFFVPYVGFYVFLYDVFGFDVDLNLKYSNMVYGEDFDYHLPSKTFKTKSDNIVFYNFNSRVLYEFEKDFYFLIDLDYLKYNASLGEMHVVDYKNQYSYVFKNASSFDNETFKTFFGILYRF